MPAGVLDRGAGRIDLAAAADPGLTLDQPSLSAGELAGRRRSRRSRSGQRAPTSSADTNGTVTTTGSRAHHHAIGDGAVGQVAASTTVSSVRRRHRRPTPSPATTRARWCSPTQATGQRLHVPVWLGVRPAADDRRAARRRRRVGVRRLVRRLRRRRTRRRSTAPGSATTTSTSAPGVLPGRARPVRLPGRRHLHRRQRQLQHQRLLPEPTTTRSPSGSTAAGGSGSAARTSAETTDSNAGFESPTMGRSRLYHGYLGPPVRRRQHVRRSGAVADRRGRGSHVRRRARSRAERRRHRQPDLDRVRRRPSRTTTRSRLPTR